jgi:hypothetical protein
VGFSKKITVRSTETGAVLFVIKLPKKLVKQAKHAAKSNNESFEDLLIRAIQNTVRNSQ